MEHNSYITDAIQLASQHQNEYFNAVVSTMDDYVVRLSVMIEPFYWHFHPDSDEIFLTLEGVLVIELENETVELSPGQLFTVRRNVPHRTSPKNGRSVNLTFERQNMETVKM